MNTRLHAFLALAMLGAMLGFILAIVGLPYGRASDDAFAELYHGTDDTTGTVHVSLDCDPFSSGTQSQCQAFASSITMGVTVGNSLGVSTSISAFNVRVTNNREDLFDPAAGSDANLNGNPDFNDALVAGDWTCTPPPPNADEDPSPTVSVSFLSCHLDVFPASVIPLPAGPPHVSLAVVTYNGAGPIGPMQTASFTLSDVSVFDDTFSEIMSCNPVVTVAGPCFGATVSWGLEGPPTQPPTFTPTPTATPVPPDTDGDGIPDAADNCPNSPNPGQENSDRNFISNAPIYVVNDQTRAMSDELGDACDPDVDNDGVNNSQDAPLPCPTSTTVTPGPGGGCGPPCDPSFYGTNMLLADTDGDRYLDGAECTLGSDPTLSSSTPAIASCGAATDMDIDGLSARIEYCFYNTNWLIADTDGDGAKDGCEAASLNTDTIVNSIDQGLLAAEILRVAPPSKLVNFDINKDGVLNSLDQGIQAGRFGKCP